MRKKELGKRVAAACVFVLLTGYPKSLAYASEVFLDGNSYTVSGAEACRRFLMEAASSVQGNERHEFYITGEDYEPETLVIAQMFPDIYRISNTRIFEEKKNGKRYVTCRIGFEKKTSQEDCHHAWVEELCEEAGCHTAGRKLSICRICKEEKEESLAPLGHEDRDQDSLCDRCGKRFFSQEEGERILVRYQTGEEEETLEFTCLCKEYGGGALYGYTEFFSADTILNRVSEFGETEEERIRWWLNNEFRNAVSVRSACIGLELLDERGQPLEEGAWKRTQEIRPGMILKAPEPGETERRFWKQGDVQIREIGGIPYQFRCVDDDYGDNNSNYQKFALFLCEAVIRSDVDSDDSKREILPFGETNNYKYSRVREWLREKENEAFHLLPSVFTGTDHAFEGKTTDGTWAEGDWDRLISHEIPFQAMWDRMFLLSVEEVLEYQEAWEAKEGTSPYSCGYWLRTPAFSEGENGTYIDGTEVYAVDLERGCLRPVLVSDGSFGIRPAFCLPQQL